MLTSDPPDVVFVNVGANDRWKRDHYYQAQMRVLVDNVLAVWPGTRVVLLNFFHMTPNRLPALKNVARSYPDGKVVCLDVRRHLVGYSDQRLHPDAESHAKLAEGLEDYLRSVLPGDRLGPMRP
jgi:lysophospholipase L1-like esterase